ncbi:MAG TPA: FHA domain-containing protein [Candidatus Limnocylindrales bacterium]|nr:FHA domain-containing protein [Candidatus Limnocylindrales bacterium]
MRSTKLILELLNGPLDGYKVTLETETFWSGKGEGPLVFPWDIELGNPQARFFFEEGNWWLESLPARHGTYRLNRENPERIEGKVKLETGDILKASGTWLLVSQIKQD